MTLAMSTGWWVLIGIAAVIPCLIVAIRRMQTRALLPYWREQHRAHRRRARLGRGMDTEELARRLGTTARQLRTVDTRYTRSEIPKRNGGTRRLDVPNDELMRYQGLILHKLLPSLRPYPAATGFEPGVSIVHNAIPHVGQAVVIKLDLVDFFPSTAADRIECYFRRVGWDAQAAALLTSLTTHNSGLPQGAPTSPRLSNLVNFVLDAQIQSYVDRHHGTYTRYADDITVSYPEDWPRHVRGTVQRVRKIAKAHGYRVHTKKKLRILRRHQRQQVTGLVVNDKVQLPRETRRRLRAVRHRLQTTGQATMTDHQVAGWDALEHMVSEHSRAPR